MKKSINLKNGENILIRFPKIEDTEGLLAMLQNSVATTDYLLLTTEETDISIEQEKKWLLSVLSDENKIMLVAIHNNKVIGNAELTCGSIIKKKHWATLGITIIDKWRNLGLGREMISTLIDLAKEKNKIEIISLEVFANNYQAIALYQKMGFEKEAQIKDCFKQIDGTYVDNIIMTLRIKE